VVMNTAANRSWSGSIYIHAEINSQKPRTEPADWALEIRGSILAKEQTAFRAATGSYAEIGIVKAFLIQVREARREACMPPLC
jgi:hypothetical protein